jgi:hypothetical protein
MIRSPEALLPVTCRLQLLRGLFEFPRRHPADASLAPFVDRLTLLQPGDAGMNHCRPNQGR